MPAARPNAQRHFCCLCCICVMLCCLLLLAACAAGAVVACECMSFFYAVRSPPMPLPPTTESTTLQLIRPRTLVRALGDTVGVALACSGQAVSQRGFWLVRGWVGARVDTRALGVLRSKAAQSYRPPPSSSLFSTRCAAQVLVMATSTVTAVRCDDGLDSTLTSRPMHEETEGRDVD